MAAILKKQRRGISEVYLPTDFQQIFVDSRFEKHWPYVRVLE